MTLPGVCGQVGILLHHDPETKAVHVKTCVKGGAAQRDGTEKTCLHMRRVRED